MTWNLWRRRRGHRSAGRVRVRPQLEGLEARQLLAVFIVSSARDFLPGPPLQTLDDVNPGNGVCSTGIPDGMGGWLRDANGQIIESGECTLRAAIEEVNASPPGPNTISFNIGTGGVQTISTVGLPPLFHPLTTIDATTQPGGTDGVPKIEVTDAGLFPMVNGLMVFGGMCTVRGLAITNFSNVGLLLTQAGGDVVEGNYVGVDLTGAPRGNASDGVLIQATSGNTIGGTTAAQRNVISSNGGNGIHTRAFGPALPTNNNVVQGNFIGLDTAGNAPLPNALDGVFLDGIGLPAGSVTGNLIGGTVTGAGNVISGNVANGVEISGAGANGNTVQGNSIGTDVTGTLPRGNAGDGVLIGSDGNTIGGTTPAQRNVISGNSGNGIHLLAVGPGLTANNNVVQGNFIGLDATGSTAVGNALDGVFLDGIGLPAGSVTGNLIGGPGAGAGNVIAGNGPNMMTANGVAISGFGANVNVVQGNFIGTDVSGTLPRGNAGIGVLIDNAVSNTIGGTTMGAGNVISDNHWEGVVLQNGAMNNAVQGNRIGTNTLGMAALGNHGAGVYIVNSSINTIAGNVISGNNSIGVLMLGGAVLNLIQGNNIGTAADGATLLGNGEQGVAVYGFNNTVLGNTIAGNGAAVPDGVLVDTGTGNLISQNAIYNNTGLGIELRNNGNNNQAAPVLLLVTGGNPAGVSGTLTSAPNTDFTLEFFANTACDPSGFGQGQEFLGQQTVTTDATGTWGFVFSFPNPDASAPFITATATDPSHNTSAFSNCLGPAPSGTAPGPNGRLVPTDAVPGGLPARVVPAPTAGLPADAPEPAVLRAVPPIGPELPSPPRSSANSPQPVTPEQLRTDHTSAEGTVDVAALDDALARLERWPLGE